MSSLEEKIARIGYRSEQNKLYGMPGSKFNKDCNVNKTATIMHGKYTVKPSRKVRPWSSK